MDWRELTEHLTGPAHLGTAAGDGQPHVAKVIPAVDAHVVWIAMWRDAKSVRNMAANAAVSLMFEPQAEVYLRARAEVIGDQAVKQRLVTAGLFGFPIDGFFGPADDDRWVLVRLQPAGATVMIEGEAGVERRTWVPAS